MKAIFLVKNTTSDKAFELRETPMPIVEKGEVLIQCEGFGLNYALCVLYFSWGWNLSQGEGCVVGFPKIHNNRARESHNMAKFVFSPN